MAFERFERVRTGGDEVPPDLRALPHPIVGYVGVLREWLDQELLASVARRLPDVSFACVGPQQTDLSRPGTWSVSGERPDERCLYE